MRPATTFADDYGVHPDAPVSAIGTLPFCAALSSRGGLTLSDLALASPQGKFRRSGSIDDRPIERTDIISFLKSGDLARSVGRIALATANAIHSRRKICLQKEADKLYV
jgi:hypothetical protein